MSANHQFNTGDRFDFPAHVTTLQLGLTWEATRTRDHEVDLDASAVLFDRRGQFVESVYFGNMKSMDGAVTHSGDATRGRSGNTPHHKDVEQITVTLPRVAPDVVAIIFAVNSYSGDDFACVETATVRLLDTTPLDGKPNQYLLGEYVLGAAGRKTGLIMAKVFRKGSQWAFHTIGETSDALNFGGMIPGMQVSLKDIIPNVVIDPVPRVMVLTKGETVTLPETASVIMGLGWDVSSGKAIDLDASCVMMDQGGAHIDHVFFNQLTSKNGAVKHTGDNRTGDGEGDDEQILVDLARLPPMVHTLYFVVNSYTGQPFAWVQNAFVRLVDNANKRELVRFDLNDDGSRGNATSMLMCKLSRYNNTWRMRAIGHGGDAKTFDQNIPQMKEEFIGVLKGNGTFHYRPNTRKGPAGGSGAGGAAANNPLAKFINSLPPQARLFLAFVIILLVYKWLFASGGGSSQGRSNVR